MPEVLINGNIYIKLAPEKKERYSVKKYTNLTNPLTGKPIQTEEDIRSLSKETRDSLVKYGLLLKEEEIKHNNEDFYQLGVFPDGYYMIGASSKLKIKLNSVSEIEEQYITLYDFLQKGVYIGRQVVSKKNHSPLYNALYQYQNMILLKVEGLDTYIIQDMHSTLLSSCELGSLLEEYYLKNDVYTAVIAQFTKNHQKGR